MEILRDEKGKNEIRLTPKMRTHLLYASLIYAADETPDSDPDIIVFHIDPEKTWDDVNAKLSELPNEELDINNPVSHKDVLPENTPPQEVAEQVKAFRITGYDVASPPDLPPVKKTEDTEPTPASEVVAETSKYLEEIVEQRDDTPESALAVMDEATKLVTEPKPREYSLDDLLGSYSVLDPGERENTPEETQACWPEGWWAFADNHGIVAYFADERDAFGFRLLRINALLNFSDIKEREESAYRPD